MRVATLLVAGAWIVSASLYAQFAVAQGAQPAQASSSSADEQPSDIVQSSAQSILKDLEANRDAYRKDPSKISTLVDKYLLPHFDTEYAARLVLAQYWRTATPEQKKRFVDAFYHSLLSNYGAALSEFTSDKLKIYPTNVDAGADRATVRTEVKRDSGDRIAVNYSMRKTPQGWKAVDVNIDGISYVKSYREDFGSQIAQQGIDSVIARLERGEKPSDISKTTKATGSKS